MKRIAIAVVVSALVLSACGKRTESSSDSNTVSTTLNAQGQPVSNAELGAAYGEELNVRVISSTPSLLTGGQETADITAAVTNKNNLPVANLPIEFSTSGGILQSAQSITDENGEATAILSLKYDSANQDIIVKAIVGDYENFARVVAEGSSLTVTGEDSVVPGTEVVIDAKLLAGDEKTPLANELITISSLAGNSLSTTSTLTDPRGRASVIVGTEKGADTITFSALNNVSTIPTVVVEHSFSVSDEQLKFASDSETELVVNVAHDFLVNWSFAGEPIVGKELVFTVTAGQVVGSPIAVTDAEGNAVVTVLSSIAGEVTLYAEAADGSLANKHTFFYVGDTPERLELSTTSSRVNTRDSATIIALITDANGNPVKNTVITFSSANLKGGQLSSTTSVTDTNGEAEITFNAGNSGTEQDEIVIRADVADADVTNSVSLTVVEPVLNVTIGSSNEVVLSGESTQYSKAYVVQVADGGGQALIDSQVQLSLKPVFYLKGQLVLVDSKGIAYKDAIDEATWSAAFWAIYPGYTIVCPSEDANGNRILDDGEDINGNGSLDPQDPALLVALADDAEGDLATLQGNGVLETDVTGSGYFRIVYPVSNAWWTNLEVIARAQALGAEATDVYRMRMPVLASEVEASVPLPPNRYSPYGSVLDCSNPN